MSVYNDTIIRELITETVAKLNEKRITTVAQITADNSITSLTDAVVRSSTGDANYTDTGALWNITGLTAGKTYTFTSTLTITVSGLGNTGVRIRNSTDSNAIVASHDYVQPASVPETSNSFVDAFTYTPIANNFNLRMQMYSLGTSVITKTSWKLLVQANA